MKRKDTNQASQTKQKFREAFLNTTEAFSTAPTVEIQANQQATVQGAKGIIEYTEELIRVSLTSMEVRFYGENLRIDCLSQDGLEIKGKITRLEYI